jgi:hypothetical protein
MGLGLPVSLVLLAPVDNLPGSSSWKTRSAFL